ncbi:isopenicillin N synthase family dioxygenase [Gayadomonas joobiniege]|uniref:isopenicillin N synthase family dioxygenase n=1 Tax=Gayadomonas joobiniege TaxID=1234606 RepID=UPI0003662A72|nr:2OG-Fe(II) oxygenase family protein [Gayadomonas joobiniege]
MLQAIDYQGPSAAKALVQSLRDTGFAVLKNHPLEQAQVNQLYQQWAGFFKQPSKADYAINSAAQDGYFGEDMAETAKGASQRDLKEYFHYYPWGQCPKELKANTQAYYQAANELAIELLSWIEEASPTSVKKSFKSPLSEMIQNSQNTLLRILHYPPLKGNETPNAIRAAAHEDINLITLLPAASAKGLEVKLNNGEWFEIPLAFGYLVINTGDMLQEASSGYFPSTTHRVVNPALSDNGSRLSMPLFLHARPDVVLSDRYTAGAYLKQRLIELGVY